MDLERSRRRTDLDALPKRTVHYRDQRQGPSARGTHLATKANSQSRKHPMSRDSIVEAIHKGIYDANLEYEKLSRGACWLNDSGCEGFMVAGIARALHEQRQGIHESLQLEMTFERILASNAEDGRRRRVDVVLLNDGNPMCVIEAKRYWEKKLCLDDLDRIRYLVEGGVPSGVLAVLVAQNGANHLATLLDRAQEDVEEWCAGLENLAVNICPSESWGYPMIWRFGHKYPRWEDWRDWKGASICIEISHP